jgi:hypothetical protein
MIIGTVQLVDLGLKTFVFPKTDKVLLYPTPLRPSSPGIKGLSKEEIKKQREEQLKFEKEQKKIRKQQKASSALAMIIVGLPVFLFHWQLAKKNNKESNRG